tara:strand:- start:36 stop:1001 length:966 start_codon:yes stop_codon:yes gene_type:complete
MYYRPILIVAGEPKSIFLEIFFKSLKLKKFKTPLILICSKKLLISQMRKLRFKMNIFDLDLNKLNIYKLNNKSINIIDVNLNSNNLNIIKPNISKAYIQDSFDMAFQLIKNKFTNKLINGPISKKTFLNGKFPGVTEMLAKNFNSKKIAMLIYNKKLSVCPITTHIPLKLVSKKISKNLIIEKTILINNFYKKIFKYKPKIAILGLNPHCESFKKLKEDEVIIRPAINKLKKLRYAVSGPFSADTMFIKQNRLNYDVIVGMYHDQVLTPIKTLYEYDAINITIGLPFIRISPDHGPNTSMFGKNISNPSSLIAAINFLDKN